MNKDSHFINQFYSRSPFNMNHLPNVPKKSLPKKGNPGLFARTIILKSG